jgi:hypothetical protein
MNKRLKLSEKQEAEVRPIIVEGVEAQHALLEKYKERHRLERNSLRSEIKKHQESMETRLDKILTAEQMKAFRKMEKEHRQQFNSEMRLPRSDRVK